MAYEFFMPKMSTSMTEGEIIRFIKKPGDKVQKGDMIMEVMTDKVAMEVETEQSGTIGKFFFSEGDSVPIGVTVGIILKDGETLPEKYVNFTGAAAPKTEEKAAPTVAVPMAASTPAAVKTIGAKRATPRAKKLAMDNGIDILTVPATGDIVNEDDVQAYIAALHDAKASPLAKKIAEGQGIDLSTVTGSGIGGKIMKADVTPEAAAPAAPATPVAAGAPNEYETQKYLGMRKIIGERLKASVVNAPHIYQTMEIVMDKCTAFRAKINEKYKDKGIKVTFNDIVVFAVVKAVKEYPDMNVALVDTEIRKYKQISVGVAADTPMGLIVPVVKNAGNMGLLEISAVTKDLVTRTKAGKALPEELKGGTITVSNLGSFGLDCFTSIINTPEGCILSIAAIKDRAIVINGQIVVKPTMYVTLGSDHRVIDGALGAKFLGCLKDYLENPEMFSL